jgi:ketosteroid isomerase-like protein
MSVNEIQTLAQRFADAFDKRDMKTVLEMLSDDRFVEIFGEKLFAVEPIGNRLDELWLPAAIVPRVQR